MELKLGDMENEALEAVAHTAESKADKITLKVGSEF
jgi:hypothetical protein